MPSSHQTVLLVDDSADTREMYALGLTLAGYHPVTAADADSALSELRREQPAAIVTDLQFADGRDGWALIEAIKRDPSTRQVPVFVLTGSADSSIALTAERIGCAGVVTKPCLPDELASMIGRVVRGAHA